MLSKDHPYWTDGDMEGQRNEETTEEERMRRTMEATNNFYSVLSPSCEAREVGLLYSD
jgi:hypothetical protein